MSEDFETIRERFEEERLSFAKKVTDLNLEVDRLSVLKSSLVTELREIKSKLSVLDNTCNLLKTEISVLKKDKETLKDSINQSSEYLIKLGKIINIKELEIKNLNNGIDSFPSKYIHLSVKKDEYRKLCSELKDVEEVLKQKKSEANTNEENLVKQRLEYEKITADSAERIAGAIDIEKRANSRIEILKSLINKAKLDQLINM